MEESELNKSISVDMTPGRLRSLHEALEDEATPYVLRIGKAGQAATKRVTIYCDAKDVEYFNKLITDGD